MPKTGTITQETVTKSSKMTSNAIEGGSSIEDHVYLNPEQIQIVGVVVKKLQLLSIKAGKHVEEPGSGDVCGKIPGK